MWKNILILLFVASIGASKLKHVKDLPSKIKPVKDLGPRIINGDQAVLGQFPWQAALDVESWLYGWFCGGSIISEEWILTAGHCVEDASSATITVGTVNVNRGDQYASAQFILHDGYDPDTLENDIGLIRLSRQLNFNSNVLTVALATSELAAGVDITVSGWGLTHDGDTSVSDVLNYVTIRTITKEECEQSYGSLGNGQVCANYVGNTVKSTCSGDSGGPAVIDITSNPIQVAIVSFGSEDGCESGAPAGFTSTAAYRDWIKTNSGV